MSQTVDYLPVATNAGANVDTQANFAGSGYQTIGFVNGTAWPFQFNKILRQVSMVAATIATWISQKLNISILDDGNLNGLITNFDNAIAAAALNAQHRIVSVPFSSTPVFDASQGTTFEIVLTGNVASSTVVNISAGQRLRFVIKQDATGGRVWTPPANVPFAAAYGTQANQVNIQGFFVDAGGSTIYVDSPLIVQ
ncbi:hypothetical protein DYQ86_15980 [Acidobacteria bacterium AB60]|nr:hypothetical protein DYQ86_15980 [Acidobacteria bacterium AB60]